MLTLSSARGCATTGEAADSGNTVATPLRRSKRVRRSPPTRRSDLKLDDIKACLMQRKSAHKTTSGVTQIVASQNDTSSTIDSPDTCNDTESDGEDTVELLALVERVEASQQSESEMAQSVDSNESKRCCYTTSTNQSRVALPTPRRTPRRSKSPSPQNRAGTKVAGKTAIVQSRQLSRRRSRETPKKARDIVHSRGHLTPKLSKTSPISRKSKSATENCGDHSLPRPHDRFEQQRIRAQILRKKRAAERRRAAKLAERAGNV